MVPEDRDPIFEKALARHLRAKLSSPRAPREGGETMGAPNASASSGVAPEFSAPEFSADAACPNPEVLAAYHERLLVPEENIRILSELIGRHRDLCQRKVRSVKFQHWLASYQGRNDARLKRWCKPAPETWKVVKYRTFLIQELFKRRILKSPV